MKKKASILVNILIFAAIAVAVGIYIATTETAPALSTGSPSEGGSPTLQSTGLIISEVMISNSGAVMDDDGDFPDWVELYNGTQSAINLSGYALSDREDNPAKYPLPATTMEPGSYKVIYLSGKSRNNAAAPLHASFKLNSEETLFLFYGSSIADQVQPGDMPSNMAYMRSESGWLLTDQYSPGFANNESGHQSYKASFDKRGTSPLLINEIMSSNVSTIADEDGEYADWIELINTGSETIDLSGYGLSDADDKPMRWRFNQGSIGPGETLVVFASGKNRQDSSNFHTNFSISGSGEPICLYDSTGALIDRVDLPEIKRDASYARMPGTDTFVESTAPTPGQANTEVNGVSLLKSFFEQNNRGVYISEVMNNNASIEVGGETSDWVEITNGGSSPVDLSGYGLSDNPELKRKFEFPSVSLSPGQSITVRLSGTENLSPENLSASFGASQNGEILYLFDQDKNMIDKFSVPALQADISYGRGSDMGHYYYKQPTPGLLNNTNGYIGLTEPVQFSEKTGVQQGAINLSLSAEDGAQIYYTTDCTEPSSSSTLYTGPIALNKTTAIRAIAVKEGYLSSQSTTATYIFGASHTVRVVSLVTDPQYLWSDEKGIYAKGPGYQEAFPHGSKNKGANFWMDWEWPVSVEVWEQDGTQLIGQGGTFKLNGQYSRAADQKAFSVYARKEFGESRFNAELFENRDYDSYKSFVLRGSGQDNNRSRMRDAMITSVMLGEDVMYQETEVCVLYLNGEYWGHYNMRERVNKWSVAQWEGITDQNTIDNIDLLKGNGKSTNQTLNGSNEEYRALIEYVRNNDLRNQENLNYVLDRVDVQNYFDYQIAEIFWANSDNGNIKFYKVPGGKWKWILYDMDWAMNNSESMPVSWNTFNHVFDRKCTGVGDSFETVLSYKLLENKEMEKLFLERLAHFMQNVYTTGNLTAAIESFETRIEPELAMHYEKFPNDGSVSSWQKHVGRLKDWVQQRPAHMLKNCKDYFSLSDQEMNNLFGSLWEELK